MWELKKCLEAIFICCAFLNGGAEIRWVTWLSASWLTDITMAYTEHSFYVQNLLNTFATTLLVEVLKRKYSLETMTGQSK